MKTADELKAELDTLNAQKDQVFAQLHMTRGYIQRVEEELAALDVAVDEVEDLDAA